MQTIRSFISIPLSPEVGRAAARLIQQLGEPQDGIKWVPTDNLHLTLKFLGEVDNREVPSVCEVIRSACQEIAPFELHFCGTGGLPSLERPRVLFAGVQDRDDQLTPLVQTLELDLAKLGFKREPRDYQPHLTLGRTKSGSRRASDEVVDRLRDADDTDLGVMVVDELQLVASFLDKSGPTYQVMHTEQL